MNELKSSKEWAAIIGVVGIGGEELAGHAPDFHFTVLVRDPDGWDRKNLEESLEEKTSKDEFVRRLQNSTCGYTFQ
jgi:hypothetical protein